jgi:hypothetical protein
MTKELGMGSAGTQAADRIAPGAIKVLLISGVMIFLGLLVLVPMWVDRLWGAESLMIDCRLPELNPPGAPGWDARCRCSDLDWTAEEEKIATSQTGSSMCWDGTPLSPEELEARMRP